MNKLRYWLDKCLENFFCFILLAMVLLALWQVFSRYFFNDPSVVTEELLRFALIWLSIMAAAYVAGKSKHVSFELFLESLTEKGKCYLNIIIQMIFMLFALIIMTYGGMMAVNVSLIQLSPILSVPMGYIYFVLPVSGLLIMLYGVLNIHDLYSKLRDLG